MWILGPILLHFFIKKLQVMDGLFEKTDWLCFVLLCFFHQEIAGDGPALRRDGPQLYRWHIWHSCYSASVTHKNPQYTCSAWLDRGRHEYVRGICLHITESVDGRVGRAVLPWGRLSLYVAMSLQGWSFDTLVHDSHFFLKYFLHFWHCSASNLFSI